MRNLLFLLFTFNCIVSFSQSIDKAFDKYDFVAGEKTIFEDIPAIDKNEKPLTKWSVTGKASVIDFESQPGISIDAYYTKLTPQLFGAKKLPDSITIEYDTWLDAGYDGNPGIEIHLMNGDAETVVTPNKHEMNVNYPGSNQQAKDNPEEYFGENKFYNRWVHISIAQLHRRLLVYLDQYKMIDIADDKVDVKTVVVSGNYSEPMKMLFRNFRIATGLPGKIAFNNGKFITYAIRFDINKSVLKPESIAVIKEVYNYLKENSSDKLEIGGHTDSDGTADYNLRLSQQRADVVVEQLASMGIDKGRLTAKGYGQTKPLDPKNTAEAKAANRRVEFTKL